MLGGLDVSTRRGRGEKGREKGKEEKGDESHIGVEGLTVIVGSCTLLRLDSD